MSNITFQDVVSYYTPRLAEQKAEKRINLNQKIYDKQSKIEEKKSKISGLESDIREALSDIDYIEADIQALPANKQNKVAGKLSKIESRRDKIDTKKARIEEIRTETIVSINQEIDELTSELANLDKRYESKLQDYIDNFRTMQSAVINNKWYKIPYGTSVQMIGLTHFFYYLGKEIQIEESTKEECESLQLTNVINSSTVNSISSTISMSNVTIDGGIFIGNIYQ